MAPPHAAGRDHGAPPPSYPGVLDRLLPSLLALLLDDPPALPGWPASTWRSALRQSRGAEHPPEALSDPRLRPLIAWVGSRTLPSHQLGAVAAALATLDAVVGQGDRDAAAVADRVIAAVTSAKPLDPGSLRKPRTSASSRMDYCALPPPSAESLDQSPFLRAATVLLHQAGYDLQGDRALAGRLGPALDVALEHWMRGSQPGGGLPAFRPEESIRSPKRLTARLGADRDLFHLIYGPQPGRGRLLQVARQRGLAYWVALSWRAERIGERVPAVPAVVLAHWRRELYRLGVPATSVVGFASHSLDAPSA